MKKIIFLSALLFIGSLIYCQTVDWTLLTGNAAFTPRDRFSVVVDSNNRINIFGGNFQDNYELADAYSTFNGIDWTVLTKNAEFMSRTGHSSVWFQNKYWVLGGFQYNWYPGLNCSNDIYNSSDGIKWNFIVNEKTDSPVSMWYGREKFTSLVFNNMIWVIGGELGNTGWNSFGNDVWYSADGYNWTQATSNAAFPARRFLTSTVFNGKMWIGGGDANNAGFNDIWYSSNGVDWYAATRNAEFNSSTIELFNDGVKLYALHAGYELWSSPDGVVWSLVTSSVDNPGARRENGLAFVNNNSLVVIGGYKGTADVNDVWVGLLSVTSPTFTPTRTPSFTKTPTPTKTASRTITPTNTPLNTFTASPTPTTQETKTSTPTITQSFTASPTITPTFTITLTHTITPTWTNSPTPTITPTITPVETIFVYYNSTDTDWHKTDVRLSWREYPGATVYKLYFTDIDRPDSFEQSIIIPLDDDINPSANVFTYTLQALIFNDRYSITITAEGGDDNVHEFSNNIVVSPKASPTAVR